MAREIETHKNSAFTRDHIGVFAVDEPGSGGANHEYVIEVHEQSRAVGPVDTGVRAGMVRRVPVQFQHGPIGEAGVNGFTDEALLAIVEDRLAAFGRGEFPSRETALARTKVQEALFWLRARQEDRANRGVAGRSEA